MQGYVSGPDGRSAVRGVLRGAGRVAGVGGCGGLQHGELEEQLEVRGRELLRRLFQDRLDLTAAREERRYDVTGADGVVRTRAERGRIGPLMTKFGQVTVSRIATGSRRATCTRWTRS